MGTARLLLTVRFALIKRVSADLGEELNHADSGHVDQVYLCLVKLFRELRSQVI